jgi:UPF0755 protein
MPLFGRQDNERSERTAEERERARQERAARRAAREGGPTPEEVAPPPLEEPPPDLAAQAPPAEPEHGDTPADDPAPGAVPFDAFAPEPEPEPDPEPREPYADAPGTDPDPFDQEPIPHRRRDDGPEEDLFEPEPPRHEEPDTFAGDPTATTEFTAAERAEAAGRRERDDETREFSAAEEADAEGRGRRRADPDELDIAWQDAARGDEAGAPVPDRPVRRIQPEPAPPPPAPAGTLPDSEPAPRPRRGRAGRRPRRGGPVVTPPGDVPRGPRRRGRRGPARWAALVALLIVIAALLYVVNLVVQPFGGDGTGSVTVNIPEGASAGTIGDVLAKADVVDSGFIFSLRANISGSRQELRSGRHVLKHDMSYGAAIAALSAKPSTAESAPVVKVTIPEGRSRREIRAIASKAGLTGSYLDATAKAPSDFSLRRYGAPRASSLEGFLFPATYEVPAGAGVRSLVSRQLDAFRENFAKVSLTTAKRRNLDAYDVLTIASMVEREARVAKERPLIAAVITNRLREGLPLGIDATIRFATGNWSKPLTQSELQRDSPYNTRLRKGLPPTPIGNPGLSSIRAAAKPANRDFLYYVVKPGTCGEHAFSSSEAQFQRDVDRYNAAREAAGGRSPTTC